MARIVLNPAIQVISGDVAGFVYRQQSDGSVVLAKQALPDPDRQPTEAQAGQMQKFKEASARYRRLLEDEGIELAYKKLLAERGTTGRLRALVIGDILKAPKISTVDLSNYQDVIGNTIRVLAEDSVGVSRLSLSISDVTSGQVVESTEKAMNGQVSGAVEWVYTATAAVEASHAVQIQVTAYDLAGNMIEASEALPPRD
jgi:hypothetical protein